MTSTPQQEDDREPPEYAREPGARLPEYRPLYRHPGEPSPPPPPDPDEPFRIRWDSKFMGAAVELGACAAAWAIMLGSGQILESGLEFAITIALLPIVVFLFTARKRALPASLIAFAIAVAATPLTCAAILSL